MLYKFKSRATADVIMLEPNGRQILQILGKEPAHSGIVTADQIPAALQALEAAVAADDAARERKGAEDDAQEDEDGQAARAEPVRLRQRAAPLIDMLRRSAAEGRDVVW